MFGYKSNRQTGYLTIDSIIRSTSKIVPCASVHQVINFGSSYVVRTQNRVFLRTQQSLHTTPLALMDRLPDVQNFKHNQEIIDGADILIEVRNLTRTIELHGEFLVSPDTRTSIDHSQRIAGIGSGLRATVNDIITYVIAAISFVVGIALLCVLLPCCLQLRQNIAVCWQRRTAPPIDYTTLAQQIPMV